MALETEQRQLDIDTATKGVHNSILNPALGLNLMAYTVNAE